jgi:hypothetical protein
MGLLDYITNAMSGGQMSDAEKQAALYAKRASTTAEPTRGEATPADLMRVMSNMKGSSPTGVGNPSEAEALRMMEAQRLAGYGNNGMGNLTNQEALRMESLKNSLPYSLYRPSGAYASPQNTMQNVLPELGGMSARNTQPTMDMNMLLRLLGR